MSWSVVIATHTDRRWDRLVEAVEAVEAQQPAPDEIILVVDHNQPLLDRIRSHFADRVIVHCEAAADGLLADIRRRLDD